MFLLQADTFKASLITDNKVDGYCHINFILNARLLALLMLQLIIGILPPKPIKARRKGSRGLHGKSKRMRKRVFLSGRLFLSSNNNIHRTADTPK